jgi:signal transduction histidine kinase
VIAFVPSHISTSQVDNANTADMRRLLCKFSAVLLLSCGAGLLIQLLQWIQGYPANWVIIANFAAGFIACPLTYHFARQGRVQLAGLIFGLFVVGAAITSALWFGFGVRAPVLVLYAIIILMVNFSLGGQTGRWVTVFGLVTLTALFALETTEWIPGIRVDRFPPAANVYILLMSLFVCAYLFSKAFQQRSNDALMDVSRKNEALNTALEQKAQANAAKDRFLAMMSHEIRTPMAGIRTAIALLQNPRTTEAARARYLTALDSSTESLLRLLNDMLDTSQLEAGALNVQNKVFCLRTLLTDTLALFALSAEQKKLSLDCDLSAIPAGEFVGDSARLRQMLSNLLGNAVKFTHTGGIRIEVCQDKPLEQDSLWMFRVCDTGPGIPESDLPRLFRPFSQLEQGVQAQTGSGLGLSIVRKLSETMGGGAGVSSEVGAGSVFWFSVRLEERNAEATLAA